MSRPVFVAFVSGDIAAGRVALFKRKNKFLTERSPNTEGPTLAILRRAWMPVVKSQVPATTTVQGQPALSARCDRAEGPASRPDGSHDSRPGNHQIGRHVRSGQLSQLRGRLSRQRSCDHGSLRSRTTAMHERPASAAQSPAINADVGCIATTTASRGTQSGSRVPHPDGLHGPRRGVRNRPSTHAESGPTPPRPAGVPALIPGDWNTPKDSSAGQGAGDRVRGKPTVRLAASGVSSSLIQSLGSSQYRLSVPTFSVPRG